MRVKPYACNVTRSLDYARLPSKKGKMRFRDMFDCEEDVYISDSSITSDVDIDTQRH